MSKERDLAGENEALRRELARLRSENKHLSTESLRKDEQIEKLSTELLRLQAAHDRLARQLFGKKAERVDPKQLELAFAEAGEELELPPAYLHEAPDEESPPPGKKRKKREGGRTKVPADLPRERREYRPTPEELVCTCCGGEKRPMGEEITEQLEYEPARFRVIEHARVKYSCARCQEGVVCPPLPPMPIEKGKPGPGLLAEVIVNKYADHQPLRRQETIFARHGVRIAKTTLCSWIAQAAKILEPIAREIGRQVLSRPVAQTDETGILVLDKHQPGGRRKGRIWVYGGLPGEVRYVYTPTKESHEPKKFLANFTGYLQADAYGGFDVLYEDGTIVEVGCNAHARRKFFDALKTSPKEASWALATYRELFKIEGEIKALEDFTPEERHAIRQERSKPIVDSFYAWLDELNDSGTVIPRTPLADAVRYARNHREALCRFLEDGRLEFDNNRSERALRKVALGRNNWLFAGSAKGAHRAAVCYTLVESCREIGVNPLDYLRDVLQQVVTPGSSKRLGELTPRGWKAAREAAVDREPELAATV